MVKKQHLTQTQLDTLKAKLLKEYGKLQKTIELIDSQDPFKNPDHVNDNASIDTDVREQMGHETVEAEVKSLQRRLKLVEKALRKMEKGTYGFDVQTGDPISYERLEIMPEVEHTINNEKRLVR